MINTDIYTFYCFLLSSSFLRTACLTDRAVRRKEKSETATAINFFIFCSFMCYG